MLIGAGVSGSIYHGGNLNRQSLLDSVRSVPFLQGVERSALFISWSIDVAQRSLRKTTGGLDAARLPCPDSDTVFGLLFVMALEEGLKNLRGGLQVSRIQQAYW